MKTSVFISWSGSVSGQIAAALHKWLSAALQNVAPFYSEDDIQKGKKWHSELCEKLSNTHIGIICVTKDNTEKPWLLYEAGALSKSMEESLVHPLLFDIEKSDITGPLSGLNLTKFDRADFKRLIRTINGATGPNALTESVLDDVFAKWWPDIEKDVTRILSDKGNQAQVARRAERDILEELLNLARSQSMHSTPQRVSLITLKNFHRALSELRLAVHMHNDENLISHLKDLDMSAMEILDSLGHVPLGALQQYLNANPPVGALHSRHHREIIAPPCDPKNVA